LNEINLSAVLQTALKKTSQHAKKKKGYYVILFIFPQNYVYLQLGLVGLVGLPLLSDQLDPKKWENETKQKLSLTLENPRVIYATLIIGRM